MAEGGGEGKARHCWVCPQEASRAEGLNQGEGGGLFRWSETADGDVSSTPDWPRRLGQCRATRAAQPLTIAATPTRSAIARRGVAAAGAGANLPVTTAGLGLGCLGRVPVLGEEAQSWVRRGRGIWAFLQSQRQGKTIVRKQVQNKNKNRTRGEKRRIADADAVASWKRRRRKKARTSRRFIARLPLSRTIDRCPLPLPVPVPGLFGFPDVFPLLFLQFFSLQATAELTERDYLRPGQAHGRLPTGRHTFL
ncbi:hypothetical protein J3E68DRAFT_187141 [Trichoderma sp. SZMC 28012]